ncbi:MAG: CCA tRNA nucleotidyltransferase, partial [Desulfobulbaceae bacterium]|nr:CCA tRNA nucleotidyltransferase [Desulfobulbaceae bacterium]
MLICKDWLKNYPHELISALSYAARCHQVEMYFAGGAVRDWLCGKVSCDLDITVNSDPFEVAKTVARQLGGTFVPLDDEEGVARVAWRMDIDFSRFREGVSTIIEDLCRRDFTINAMAVKFDPDLPGLEYPYDIIDPTGGADDLKNGIIRAVSESVFVKDPLRLIRAYRFMASFGFALDPVTKQLIRKCSGLIGTAATERISYEMERIMASDRASDVIGLMAEIGLVWKIFPELKRGVGCKQPASHHLDVFSHNLETLKMMEQLQQSPAEYFPGHGRELKEYLEQKRRRVWLRWAAFFHDIAKPETYELRDGRRTFYNHDRSGGRKF